MKFDSGGLFKRSNSEEIIVDTEKDLFEVLGLEYIRKWDHTVIPRF
jgi:DNA polymerase mu